MLFLHVFKCGSEHESVSLYFLFIPWSFFFHLLESLSTQVDVPVSLYECWDEGVWMEGAKLDPKGWHCHWTLVVMVMSFIIIHSGNPSFVGCIFIEGKDTLFCEVLFVEDDLLACS